MSNLSRLQDFNYGKNYGLEEYSVVPPDSFI